MATQVGEIELQIEPADIALELVEQTNKKALTRVRAGKYMFILGEDEEADKELRELISIVRSEEGNF